MRRQLFVKGTWPLLSGRFPWRVPCASQVLDRGAEAVARFNLLTYCSDSVIFFVTAPLAVDLRSLQNFAASFLVGALIS
jgi:hypothetical protein